MRLGVSARFVALLFALTSRGGAQASDLLTPAAIAKGAFVGFIKNSGTNAPVQSADVRLYFVDSSVVRHRPGTMPDYLETYVDTVRSRLAVSDSTGYFAIWHLAAGRYMLMVRRIGFGYTEAVVTVDSGTVVYDFGMEAVRPLLAAVEIKESSSHNTVARRQDRVGFTSRKKFEDGQFIQPADITKRQSQTVGDILAVYGIRGSADIVLDRMPVDFSDVIDYPAELIAGIEVYRHGRPMEFSRTRFGPSVSDSGGLAFLMRPLILIWTYIP